MLLHTWVKRTLNIDDPQEAREIIEDWIENQEIDFSSRVVKNIHFEYQERQYKKEPVEIVSGIPQDILNELYSKFDNSIETLNRIRWCLEDKIKPEIMKQFDVACKDSNTIILPHHNVNGEIVGIYERSFKPLRRDIKKQYPDISWQLLLTYPRAKYVPMLKDEQYRTEEKTSWSFPNSRNLYGLHLAAPHIAKHKKAIIFEGGKSVMLSHQYGYPYAVATHTFGAHLNHITMLIECGAQEIILAFDKQYEQEVGQAWELYEKKTCDLANKVKDYVKVSRIRDKNNILEFKDAPIDKGLDIFETLYFEREDLHNQKELQKNIYEIKQSQDAALKANKITIDINPLYEFFNFANIGD